MATTPIDQCTIAGQALANPGDILPYLIPSNGSRVGPFYVLKTAEGREESVQSINTGNNHFYHAKGRNWEQFYYDSAARVIYRKFDTSPGTIGPNNEGRAEDSERFYVQYVSGNSRGAPWINQNGNATNARHSVQFYFKDDCERSALNSGSSTNSVRFQSRTCVEFTLKNQPKVRLDVITLVNSSEVYHYAKGIGLVGWGANWTTNGGGSSILSHFLEGNNNDFEEPGFMTNAVSKMTCNLNDLYNQLMN